MADDAATKAMYSVLAWSRVADLRDAAAELTALCHDVQPRKDLLDHLSPDRDESRLELLCLYLRERGMRRRMRELLAGETIEDIESDTCRETSATLPPSKA